MDSTEDLSARVLVRQILNEEPPRTPLTRSAAARISSGARRSGRLTRNDPGAQMPQQMLRRSLKHKIRESISSKVLPSKRRTVSAVLKRTPGPSSMLFDDEETPRQILKNILLTEPVKSPLVNKKVESQQPQPSPTSSLHSRRPSTEGSGLDLPDLTIGNVETTIKRLVRKRPHRSLNVTDFEKRIKDAIDAEEESSDDPSSLSLPSSTSLSLETPFFDAATERKGLRRKVFDRKKITEEDFAAAVDKRERGNYHGTSSLAPGQALGESAYSEGFTLGLSKFSEPDITASVEPNITTDIIHCNTALYAKTDAAMSNYSTVATQDKSTVMASQIQKDMMEQKDVIQKLYPFPMENITAIEDQDQPDMTEGPEENPAAPAQSEQEKTVTKSTFDTSGSGKAENVQQLNLEEADSQTEEDDEAGSSSESRDEAGGQTESQGDDDGDDEDEARDEEPEVEQQSHREDLEEEEETDSETNIEKQRSEDDAQEEEEEEQEEEEQQELVESDMETAEEGDEEDEEDEAAEDLQSDDTQPEENEENLENSEHKTQRAQLQEDELIVPFQSTEADLAENTEPDIPASPAHKDDSEADTDTDTDEENVLEENEPPDDVEQMEQSGQESEEEGDEDEEIPLRTPAFVRQKRNFFNLKPQVPPFAPKSSQPSDAGPSQPGAKPKQKAQRKPRAKDTDPALPKSYLMNVFKHFAKTKVSADVYPVLKDIMDKFFDRMAKDLETYAHHAGRSTIDFSDCEMLLRRQGHVNDKVPVEVLIEKYLRMDQRRLLIPIAMSGNAVFPKKR